MQCGGAAHLGVVEPSAPRSRWPSYADAPSRACPRRPRRRAVYHNCSAQHNNSRTRGSCGEGEASVFGWALWGGAWGGAFFRPWALNPCNSGRDSGPELADSDLLLAKLKSFSCVSNTFSGVLLGFHLQLDSTYCSTHFDLLPLQGNFYIVVELEFLHARRAPKTRELRDNTRRTHAFHPIRPQATARPPWTCSAPFRSVRVMHRRPHTHTHSSIAVRRSSDRRGPRTRPRILSLDAHADQEP